MTHEYRIHKDPRTGWRAETAIKLGDNWQLDITTRKNARGAVITHVSVAKSERGFLTHRMYTDYSKTVSINADVRCTEKAVTEQHRAALELVGSIKEEVRLHYAGIGETIGDPVTAAG